MSTESKFTWGDSVVLVGTGEIASVCAITERDDGIFYTVEFSDGSDGLLNEEALARPSDQD